MEQVFRALPSVLKGLGPDRRSDEAMVLAAWGRCAGEMLRKRTQPLEFFENRLVVAVADETWRRHLEDLSPQMLYTLNESLGQGTIRFIEFRVDARAVSRAIKKSARSTTKKAVVDPSLEAAAEAISDDELRKRFLEAAGSCLSKTSRGQAE
jgi:hypothetical protein